VEKLKWHAMCKEKIQCEKREKSEYENNFESYRTSLSQYSRNNPRQCQIDKSRIGSRGKSLQRLGPVFLGAERKVFKMRFWCNGLWK